jgi:hypothetical protein
VPLDRGEELLGQARADVAQLLLRVVEVADELSDL